jgi:hypothetical protein
VILVVTASLLGAVVLLSRSFIFSRSRRADDAERERNDRLLRPDWALVEREFGGGIPEAFRELLF